MEPTAIADSGNVSPIDGGLRNAWQWLAMVTMTLDHVGYLYTQYDFLRYAGRLAMPLYAMLFVMTIRTGRVNHWRVLIIATIAQIPYSCLFNFDSFEKLDLNIIFGFYIFYWLTVTIEKRQWIGLCIVAAAMCIPVSYGWYLYSSMAAFYWLAHNPRNQRSVFALLTIVYTWVAAVHPRQLLAMGVPFIQGIRLPRPNKYLYRYFYPGHLLILLIINICIMGYVVTPFGEFPEWNPADDQGDYYEYYDDTAEPDETCEPIL
jgi:hypothetical protein